jgi:sucrose-6F-phosphate phosphohydrolase
MHRSSAPEPDRPPLLLVCDFDQTLLPNGTEPRHEESETAFAAFVHKSPVTFASASGRSLTRTIAAAAEYNFPEPNIVIADLGTSIYWKKDGRYVQDIIWQSKLHDRWHDFTADRVAQLLRSTLIAKSKLQEPECLGEFKLSYYTPHEASLDEVTEIQKILTINGISANVVSSYNVAGQFGFLDILPTGADKGTALAYIMSKLRLDRDNVVFAGDSGNDLAALLSGVRGIVVNNASADFKAQVKAEAESQQLTSRIYLAHGTLPNNPGHYAGGIIEGLVHFGLMHT